MSDGPRHTKRHSRRGSIEMTVTVVRPIFAFAAVQSSVLTPTPRPPMAPRGATAHVVVEAANVVKLRPTLEVVDRLRRVPDT